jgi:uncharacterized membrane protein
MISIGELLFNKLYILFISAAILLFIAMVGAIILTMDEDEDIELFKQVEKRKMDELRFSSTNIN